MPGGFPVVEQHGAARVRGAQAEPLPLRLHRRQVHLGHRLPDTHDQGSIWKNYTSAESNFGQISTLKTADFKFIIDNNRVFEGISKPYNEK
jgi:hypothetical protein